ncbi:Uncharacterised protein [Streptococcus pneumoniae]|nr:Uncharacterised protein [Streptococcus pneumoniae]
MEHLFKMIILLPCFYFFSWIDKDNRESKFFPIFYYFYWIYITLYALFSLAWTVFSVLFFNIVLRNLTDIKLWGIWLLLLLIAFASDWLDYICFKKMLDLRRELGKSKGGRHCFIPRKSLQTTSTSPWIIEISSVLSTTSKQCFEQLTLAS